MSERMTAERLDEIKARADATTPGSWSVEVDNERRGWHTIRAGRSFVLPVATVHVQRFGESYEESGINAKSTDLAFIANAREDVPAMLAEIERAWGEIEATDKAGEALCETVDRAPVTKLEHLLTRRLAHAHDSANALYRTVESIVSDYDPSEDTPAIARLRAAIDPALTSAALAETQRRDGLDEQVRTLTADRDEWRRIAEEQAAMLLVRGPEMATTAGAAWHCSAREVGP